MLKSWKKIQEVKQLTDKPFGVNLFVPSENHYLPDQVEHMNAWLKPYRRAFNLERTCSKCDRRNTIQASDRHDH